MAGKTITCKHCGAVCNEHDGFCKSCWKKLSDDVKTNDHIIDGIGRSEWEGFIEKKAARYIDVYTKYEGKKWFAHMNWAALIFGFRWLLYRKMNKLAFIGYFLWCLLTFLIVVGGIYIQAPQIKANNIAIEAYESYLDAGGKTVLYDENGNSFEPDVVTAGKKAKKSLEKVLDGVSVSARVCFLLPPVIIGLFGDALYKSHFLKNTKSKDTGTSMLAALFGGGLLSLLDILLLPLFSALIVLMGSMAL